MKKNHLAAVDELRGVAILMVFFYHALGVSFGYGRERQWSGLFRNWDMSVGQFGFLPLSYGFLGVSLFFVISGFCIHLSYSQSRDKSLRVFFIRRAFRIYPPYLVALLIFSFFYPFQRVVFSEDGLFQFVSHLTLLHNWDVHTFFGINGAFWSIAVEAQLYLLYPLLFLFAKKAGWGRTLLMTALVEISLRTIAAITVLRDPSQNLHLESPFSFWFCWCLGAYLAENYLRGKPLPKSKLSMVILAGLVVGSDFIKPLSVYMYLLSALFFAGLITFLIDRSAQESTANPPLWRKFFAQVGLLSYSLYLLHQPLLELIPAITSYAGPALSGPLVRMGACIVSFVFIYLCSVIFYRFVELPSIAWGKNHLAK
ncbi:acyltransferase family protein [Oleiharenicola lentus]|uniref:acyltransferase family protein n=1 Tax=Oleiharenicola lentus TaxID=2508720 RepID=UPI003F66DE53